jgi:hypothetical protein
MHQPKIKIIVSYLTIMIQLRTQTFLAYLEIGYRLLWLSGELGGRGNVVEIFLLKLNTSKCTVISYGSIILNRENGQRYMKAPSWYLTR